MTRWARANNVHRHKPSEATPWNQLKKAQKRPNADDRPTKSSISEPEHLRPALPQGPASKKVRRKRDFADEDVNGFMQFLQQSGQMRASGPGFTAEVESAVKKDQRREHRRVKRQNDKKNKMLCFNCRKPGHGLSECPEADRDEEMGRGICYRCGSTEHEIHKCRAKIDPALGEFPFAKCFICGQTGHLSRSCPDNPKGLYAQGGSCRICGSVEHFQKDCPEHQAATNTMTLKWLSNNMSADHEDVHVPVKKDKPKQTKVVVF